MLEVEGVMTQTFKRRMVQNPFYMLAIVLGAVFMFLFLMHVTSTHITYNRDSTDSHIFWYTSKKELLII